MTPADDPDGAREPRAGPRIARGSRGGRRSRGKGIERMRRVEEVSAGGLVVRDQDGQVVGVLIAKHDRRGRLVWSLPKGHVEDGETLEQTAVREVREETGVAGEVVGPLGQVDYWFVFGGQKIHKTVHHFLLRRLSGELSDHDVEVVEVAWVPLPEIPERLAYPDERRLMGHVRELLAKSA
ncbi:MAG: NUDIX hydrolase [Micromonosporaceae bacterium]